VVSDLKLPEQLAPIINELADVELELVLGEHPISLLDGADVLAISGGVSPDAPFVQEAIRRGIPLTNDSLEFMKRAETTLIGITGSAGKTTTAALTGEILKAAGRRTWVGGNIGRPLIAELDSIGKKDVVVQELSSFQLELWTQSPPVAAVLNITPNHLDRHLTMETYTAAKTNIVRYQRQEDVAVLSADDPGASDLRKVVRGRARDFSIDRAIDDGSLIRDGGIWLRDGESERYVMDLEEIPLRGKHNMLNVLASAALADTVGVGVDTIRHAVMSFEGVEHRLELVRTINGVQYVNDSIATAPERALAAVDSFSEPILLLAGGRDKDMVWTEWARHVQRKVKVIILFGEIAALLESHLQVASESWEGQETTIIRAGNMEDALTKARDISIPGDVVLLSPGGTSFDAYDNFAERGDIFRQLVLAIPSRSEHSAVAP
jgi:UDP-N-acetylmuramoylalanine--D-glutamate ligase